MNVFVTGSGSGIGLAFVTHARRCGHRVAGLLRTHDRCAVSSQLGVAPVVADLRSADSAAIITDSLRKWLDGEPLDAVVHCAGILRRGGLAAEDDTALSEQLEVNVVGTVRAVGASVQLLRPGGRVVVLGAAASYLPVPWLAGYAASKAAAESVIVALRRSLPPPRLIVTNLVLGPVDTPMLRQSSSSDRWESVISPESVATSITRILNSRRPPLRAFLPRSLGWRMRWLEWLPSRRLDAKLMRGDTSSTDRES